MNAFLDLVRSRGVILGDGGLGTGLFGQGLETGDSPELWNADHPDRVAAVHRGFVEAGSDLLLTNSFGGTRYRLALHGADGRVAELNRAAARVAREVAASVDRPVIVAGSIGPTGELLAPLGTLTHDAAAHAFAEQAQALAEGGVDLLWIETMSAAGEVEAAVEGAATTGLPIVTTLSFDTNGRTMMGLTTDAVTSLVRRLPTRPVGYGANCGVGPAQLAASLIGFARTAEPDDILVAKGNCGIPQYRDGHIHYSGTPEIMAAYATIVRDAGARVIGGCCGTEPRHIEAMRRALDTTERGAPPTLDDVERVLGPVAVERTEEPVRRRRRAG